jgi:hypothetical protein
MNALLPRFIKTAYRKEPISGFIIIVGAIDAILGGVGERWSLLSFGLFVVFVAAMWRWWQIQKTQEVVAQEAPRRYLPPSSSRTPLPMLTSEKHRR